jgi:hypothetical protein
LVLHIGVKETELEIETERENLTFIERGVKHYVLALERQVLEMIL